MTATTNIVAIARDNAQQHANKTAYTYLGNGEDVEIAHSYSELDSCARRLAANLQQQGLQAGDRVVLLFCPGMDFVEALFACFYAGIIAVPVNPPSSNGQSWANFLSILSNAQASLILADNKKVKFLDRQYTVNQQTPEVKIVDIADTRNSNPDDFSAVEIQPETIAMLQYTSGSTGLPKGVMVNHRNIMHNMQIIDEQIYLGHKTTVSWLPVYHDMGLFGAILQIMYQAGHCVMMPPTSFLMRPLRWLKAISHYQASVSGGPNFCFDLCVDMVPPEAIAELDLSCWKIAASGAEPVLAPTLRRFGKTFFKTGFNPKAFVPCYGLAEATLLACANKRDNNKPPTTISVSKSDLKQGRITLSQTEGDSKEFVSCGLPQNQEIQIVNPETLELMPADQVGEVWISSPSISSGYWNQAEKTAEVFGKHINGSGNYYRSGDLGFLHQGEIYIAGRIKDLIIIAGKNHYPGDIERTIQASHDSLKLDSGAVFTIDIEGVEHLVIAQEIQQNHIKTLDADAVIKAIKTSASRFHEVPVHAVCLCKPGQIHKTSSGKIRRSTCRDTYLESGFENVGHWQSEKLRTALN